METLTETSILPITNYKILFPLSDEHYYNLILESEPSDDLIIKTYNFVQSICNKKNNINTQSPAKKIIRFIKEQIREEQNSLVWLVLIKLLPYNLWIDLYSNCNVLRYFWSKELLEQIIDSNRNQINLNILNKFNVKLDDTLTNTSTNTSTDISTNSLNSLNLVNLLNQYDLNWNFTQNVLLKRYNNYFNAMFNNIFNQFDITNFCSDQTLIKLLGNNQIGKFIGSNCSTHCSMSNQVQINFYPLNNCSIKLKNGIKYESDERQFIIYYNNFKLVFFRQIVSFDNIFAQQNVMGYIVFSKLNKQNNQSPFLSNVYVTAELYQQFNKHNYEQLQILQSQINLGTINDQNLQIAQDYCVFKFCKYLQINTCIRHDYSRCYECKKYYDNTFCLSAYKAYCFDCGIKHYSNKIESVQLNGYTVFITGIRVKIGFATALRILRNGGKVIGTTRYPHFAISNYAKEPDYNMWKSNISIIKCDFLNIESVYKLLDIITSNNYQINAFINMAFRTVKTSTFYSEAVRSIETNLEKRFYLENEQLNNFTNVVKYNGAQNKQILFDNDILSKANTNSLVTYQMPVKINIFKDVVDAKLECSWDKTIDKIDPKEIVECMAINQLVPTLIINSLKSKLINPLKTIINICSFEGQFNYEKKTDKHIHTNMCKSALNMLIRSLCEDSDPTFRAFTIDPGYVSGKKTNPELNELPVSMDDAAAKIMWPIFRHFKGNPLDKSWIKIRNYNKEPW